ncbi:Cyclic nucleotide-binding protein [Pseudocohnilembus persalinus]|uniref:Cyclic nucleotide-binding protein n=1 Tax=Pseudocohnilembus persalinus TaxID=266149 RepID=A0A0V0R7C7_PSEPJ|nr:Cyclic nucleotide-binding protein [Pseudocohnilembus persalinus]|eukprot:KRX10404.1 Cyclic nucleotide-binding protein [Pseudocohnilembus persalinus]
MIIQRYCNDHIYFDLTNLFIVVEILTISQLNKYSYLKYINLIYFTKIKDLKTIVYILQERMLVSKFNRQALRLILLLSQYLLVSHLLSFFWIELHCIEIKNDYKQTWMDSRNLRDQNWLTQYIYTFYFNIVTMSTVGYGDITPVTTLETFFNIISTTIACIIFGFTLNSIGQILNDINKQKEEISQKIYVMNNYMREKKINFRLQQEIREYMSFYLKEFRDNNQKDQEEVISLLSEQLKGILLLEANKIVLKESKIFKENFSQKIIQNTIPLITERKCRPNEIIFSNQQSEENTNNLNIYFIQKGKFQLYVEQNREDQKRRICQNQQNMIEILNEGESFGNDSFFTGFSPKYSIKSLDFSCLLCINRKDFLQLLKNYEEDYQRFCHIKDKILQNNLSRIKLPCKLCQEINHSFPTCPLIHYKPNELQIIQKHLISTPNQRNQKFSRRLKSYSYNKQYGNNIQEVINILEKNEQFLSQTEWKNIYNDDEILEPSFYSECSSPIDSENDSSYIDEEQFYKNNSQYKNNVESKKNYQQMSEIEQELTPSQSSENELNNQNTIKQNTQKEIQQNTSLVLNKNQDSINFKQQRCNSSSSQNSSKIINQSSDQINNLSIGFGSKSFAKDKI